jgi:hypothetical protein
VIIGEGEVDCNLILYTVYCGLELWRINVTLIGNERRSIARRKQIVELDFRFQLEVS